jgi:hypothetical protein
MKYLKVFTDFVADMSELGDAERGRLFTAMLEYAETGEEPALRGNERFVWGTAKKNIDNQRDSYDRRCEINRANGSEPKRKQAKASESLQDKEKEKEIKEIDTKVSTKKSSAFQPPTLEEVKARCAEKGYTLDPVAFMSYYNANGWKVGRTKMVSWVDALAGWESREKQYRRPKQNAALKYEQKPISKTDFDALVVNLGEEDK